MTTFLIPAISVIVVFWLTCAVMYLLIKWQLAPIVRSIRRLELRNQGRPDTRDYVTEQPKPRPIPPSRYVTVDRSMKTY